MVLQSSKFVLRNLGYQSVSMLSMFYTLSFNLSSYSILMKTRFEVPGSTTEMNAIQLGDGITTKFVFQ